MSLAPAALRQWDGLIVLCAANGYDGIRLADWHLARHLSRLAPVLYVDPPVSPLASVRNPDAADALRRPRLRLQKPGLACLTPVVLPFPSRRGMTGMASALTRRYIRRAVAALGGDVAAVLSAWPQYPAWGCGEKSRAYWAQDDFVGGAALLGLSAAMLAQRERRVAAAADLIIAASPVLAQAWRGRGRETVLIPNGVSATDYAAVDDAPLPAGVSLPPPIATFIGHINDRTDLSLLEAVADRGRSLLLVGPKSAAFDPAGFTALTARPNVHWAGPQPFASLPGWLRMTDVGLVPYRDSAFNRGCFPLKTLEYLAAGRAVVATGLPATRWLATDLVCIADGTKSFADQVDRLLAQPRTPALMARRRAFAGEHSWARRADAIYAAIAGQ